MSEDVEQAFIDAIRKDPGDEEARAVYADWLDQRGDPRGEYLRLESLLHRGPLRLADLVGTIDRGWLDAVARTYDVVLGDIGHNKILVIKTIRELTGLGLKDSKDIADAASNRTPRILREGLDHGEAIATARRFDGTGATVRIAPHHVDPGPILQSPPLPPGVTVLLESIVPERRLDVIWAVRQITSLGLREARDLVDKVSSGTPCRLLDGVDRSRVAEIAAHFQHTATIAIEPVTKPLV